MTRRSFVPSFVLALAAAACGSDQRAASMAPLVLPASGPITVAATGDTLLVHPIPRAQQDAAFAAALEPIRRADVAVTNLELNLLSDTAARTARSRPGAHWPFASAREAGELKRLGFDVVTLANNHATDYGIEGLADTEGILDRSGLLHAGSGPDLGRARAPVLIGGGARRIALIAVTTSSAPESRATPARGEIIGRPGVNPLRYVADITVDPRTFQTIKESLPALHAGPAPVDDRQLTFFGTPIKKGDRTSVDFVVDAKDQSEIIDEIGAARRRQAEIVIVSIHSHEPTSASELPADFVRRFAHAAIDAGAALVAVHGPHRVRGIEIYKRGAILYSLGNFLYQTEGLDFGTADVFDGGRDLYSLTMGALGDREMRRPGLERDDWWQSIVAIAAFDRGSLASLRLEPIDLGVGLPADAKGTPRLAAPPRASAILEEVIRLSRPYDTPMRIDRGIAIVNIP